MSAEQLRWVYPAANLRRAYTEGRAHPSDWPEDWGYRTFSAEGDAFRAGQKERNEVGSAA
jgi:hypothetical protein